MIGFWILLGSAIVKERIGNFQRGVIWWAGALGALTLAAQVAQAGGSEDALNMARIGHADLQGRPSYEPTAIQQGNRFILYVGHHQGNFFNPLTQAVEPDGTSIVDVANPANPRQLFHIPGPPGGNQDNSMVRVCPGPYQTSDGVHGLPNAMPGHFYMLRVFGSQAHEIWDTTDPSKPVFVTTIVSRLDATHKNWWECDTGSAYLATHKASQNWHGIHHLTLDARKHATS